MDELPIPHILPRHEHLISRSRIDPDALKVLYRLRHHGFQAYLVGGCVRDLLLGKAPKDFDVVTDAHPQQVREIFRNSRLIGRRFRLAQVFFKGGKFIEVSTFRRRSEFEDEGEKDPRRSDNTFGTPAEDALRRDITINGIFYNIDDFSLIDYVGGLEDLNRKMIRCIGDPEEKFTSDPVRMIRVIRHAARTGFSIEEKTYRTLIQHVEKLRLCSPSRLREEFLREIREGSAKNSIKQMMESGILLALFPPFLKPLAAERPQEYFFNILSLLDDFSLAGKPPAEEFCVALFLLPLLEFSIPSEGFPLGRRGQALFQQWVREWITATLGPLQFARLVKEAVVHLLSTQRILLEFGGGRKLPWRLARQPYFSQALLLSEISARARGEVPEKFSRATEEKRSFRKKKRNRHRRKKKPSSFPDQKIEEISTNHSSETPVP
jgi:poly(A) polymerase